MKEKASSRLIAFMRKIVQRLARDAGLRRQNCRVRTQYQAKVALAA